MKSFDFPLEKALEWRRTQLEQAESRFKQQAAVLAEIDRERAELEAEDLRAEIEVRAWRPVWSGDLAALGRFRLQTQKREKNLYARRAECERELDRRQGAMMEARRRFRLLERLKERRLADWRAAYDRELEQQAAESYLAQWSR
jgi:hypothetical protein